ncbi:MAG: hypothetical protein B7X57_10585, partial [Erythrobacter sp. 34-65-8]
FRVCWEDDNHRVRVQRGWRVQNNNAIGPYMITQEQLEEYPRATLAKVMHHIGAGDPDTVDFSKRANMASQLPTVPRSAKAQHYTRPGSRFDRMLRQVAPVQMASSLKARIDSLNALPAPAFPIAVQDKLRRYYLPDITATEALTGLNLENWKIPRLSRLRHRLAQSEGNRPATA